MHVVGDSVYDKVAIVLVVDCREIWIGADWGFRDVWKVKVPKINSCTVVSS